MKKWIVLILSSLVLFTSCLNYYSNDGKEVTYHQRNWNTGHHIQILDADPASFKVLRKGYAKDDKHAFYRGNIIKNADGKSFNLLSHYYSCDSHHVFYFDEIIKNADPKSFKVYNETYAEDKNDYFIRGEALNVADKSTFKFIGNNNELISFKAKAKANARLERYVVTGILWAKDTVQYYLFHWMKGNRVGQYTDYDSFYPISEHSAFASDKNKVYYFNNVVPGADPSSFFIVESSIGQDSARVYYGSKPTEIKDFSKLSVLGGLYNKMYKDSMHVYNNEFKVVPDADPISFRHLERDVFADSNHVFIRDEIIPEADPSTFNHLGEGWYSDKNNVYSGSKLIKGADVKTFKLIPLKAYYPRTGIIDNGHFDSNYAKDAYHVFLKDSILQGADPNTFEIWDLGEWTIFDKNKIYKGKETEWLKEYRSKYQ